MKSRVIGYDLARALAVVGMVIVNFKIVMGCQNGPGWLFDLVGLIEGRAAATFVVLAGVGMSLMSKRAALEKDSLLLSVHRRVLHKRALFLFVVGLTYTPLWPADILHFYGVYIAVGAFLLGTSSDRLWRYAIALVLLFTLMIFVFDYEKGWNWQTLSYEGIWTPAGMLRHLFFNGFHPVIPWLAFLLVGMAIGRLDMTHSAIRRRVTWIGFIVALTAELVSILTISQFTGIEGIEMETVRALLGTSPMPPMPLYMLAGTGTACVLIGVSVEVGLRFKDNPWIKPFVATGQLALTLYVAHVVVGMGVLESLGRLENQSLQFSLLSSAVFCLSGVIFAAIWRSRFKRGPLEYAMRSVTGGSA